jgi:integrase
MPKVELKDRFCASVKPGADKVEYFDTVTTGLAFMVTPAGAKTFYLAYTSPTDGKRARMKLGRYPELTLAKARQKAKDARGEIGDRIDPLREQRALEASQSVSDLIDNYVLRHASTKRSGKAIERRLRKNVAGVIGHVKLAELHRRDITKCIDAVKDRGRDTEANRVFEDLRAMIRWARGRGDLDENLVDGMRKPSETAPRERVLTADEIKTMWEALPGADMREGTRRVIRLCLITGQRVGEVASMRIADIDIDARMWTIPATISKNGREHAVPLSDMAISIVHEQIAEAKSLAKRKGRPLPSFIFPAPGGRTAMAGAAVPHALKREQGKDGRILGIEAFTPHDLRRSMATHLEGLGVSPFVIGHVLNHISVTKASVTSKVYARYDYGKEKRAALELWADRLQAIIAGDADKIVPLTARAAS